MRDHNRLYTLLNVLPDADPVVIEAAYKALMKRCHPDVHPQGAAAGERTAAELNHAYQTLRDPDRRAAYDAGERLREERRRAELARAIQSQPARAAQPAPHAEKARAGQRIAGWIGAAGVLMLGGALYLLSQGNGGATQPRAAPAPRSAPTPSAPEQAFRDQPVSFDEVEKAVGAFRRISGQSGLAGAAAYSQRCFDQLARSGAVTAFDHCVAFDHVASRAELAVGDSGPSRFRPYDQVPRHVRAAERMARDPGLIEARLLEIRRLVDSELRRLATAAALAGAIPRPQPPRPATPRLAVEREVSRPAATSEPPRRQPDRDDFLERQGGIY